MFTYINELYERAGKVLQLKEIADWTAIARGNATSKAFQRVEKISNSLNDVLEIGSESGFITEYIQKDILSTSDCRLDVMDLSESFLENVKNKRFPVREYIQFDITNQKLEMPYRNRYDLIFLQEVLEHLVAPFIALTNINEMLKPGGYLYLTIPNTNHWSMVFFRQKAIVKRGSLLDTHISEISPMGLVKLVSMAGFDVIDIDYYASKSRMFNFLRSSQVGFLLRKSTAPEDRWHDLANQLIARWEKQKMGNRNS